MKHITHLLAILHFSSLTLLSQPAFTLDSLFSDHMVIQREQAIPIRGFATPGDQVSITFADQTKTIQADQQGKWSVMLDPLKANATGSELIAKSANENREIKITDILIGDVWLCSGQSNMHFQMKSVENAPQEIVAMNFPKVRFFTMKQTVGQEPSRESAGEWKPVSPTTASDCSAVACYFGTALQRENGIPIGLIVSSVGGTRIESWMRHETLVATGESLTLIEKWKNITPAEFEKIAAAYSAFQHQRDHIHPKAVQEAKAQGKPAPTPPIAPKIRCHDCPSSLHNGMIAPLQSYAIRGVIWYQGESNAGQPAPYQKLLPAMINDWRGVWGKDLPFLFVQIAPHRSIHPSFREAQHLIWQNTPRTAMVVTTDLGNAENIHPTRKRPVGERLALAARALSYAENVVSSGPVFKDIQIKESRAIISFTHEGGGLIAKGGALKGFTIADKDGKFLPAQAIIEGGTVIVTSEKISQPTAVRYNWAFMPDGNLFNREDLPAAPFRTDLPAAANR
jgi:sialate O-acetylesterase